MLDAKHDTRRLTPTANAIAEIGVGNLSSFHPISCIALPRTQSETVNYASLSFHQLGSVYFNGEGIDTGIFQQSGAFSLQVTLLLLESKQHAIAM